MKNEIIFWCITAILCALITDDNIHAATTQKHYFAHDAVEDQYGVIAPWYPGLNGQCDYRVRVAAETLKRYPWTDGKTEHVELPAYMVNGRWNIDAEGNIKVIPWDRPQRKDWPNWPNGDYGSRAYSVLCGWSNYYRYTSDATAIAHIKMMADHLLDYTLTPADHPWPMFPISVPVKGQGYQDYDPTSFIQLDIAAYEGLALLRAYQLVGEARWLAAAQHWGDLFARHLYEAGEPAGAPWGRYANPEDVRRQWKGPASSPALNHLTGGVALILQFLDELIRLGYTGQDNQIVAARDAALKYLKEYLLPRWTAEDTWGRHYWDWEASTQTISPTDNAVQCMLQHAEYFPDWRTDVRNILNLFLNRSGVNPNSMGEVYSGAWAYPESSSCCSKSLDYAPLILSTIYAEYGQKAQSDWALEMARRQIIISTYHFHDNGVVEDNINSGFIVANNWFKIVHPIPLLQVLETMGWLPEELGANRENHIMRSSAVVNSVAYAKGKIEYTTFDAPANTVDVLRLAFAPQKITADGQQLEAQKDLQQNGYTLKELSNGDCIASIRHDGCRKIVVTGDDPQETTDDKAMIYTGQWRTCAAAGSASGASSVSSAGGNVHLSDVAGAAAEYEFTGNQVRLIGGTGPAGGLAEVFLDGQKQQAQIDCWNPSARFGQVLYYRNGLADGRHVLRIIVQGQKNPHASGKEVYIQAVQYSSARGSSGFGEGQGPTQAQRMIFGYTGRKPIIDSQGNEWQIGEEFVARTGKMTDVVAKAWWTQPVKESINDTPDPQLYRYGVHAPDFWVNVTTGPGKYQVKLRFAERREPAEEPNQQWITVHINGEKVISDLDLADRAGGRYRPLDLVFDNIAPRHGVIEIRFTNNHGGEAIVQAMEVIPRPQ